MLYVLYSCFNYFLCFLSLFVPIKSSISDGIWATNVRQSITLTSVAPTPT